MRIPIFIVLLLGLVSLKAQTEIVAMPGEYMEAENYGGKVDFKRFLQQEMKYPSKALALKKEGTVELAFVVDLKGNTSQMHVKSSVSEALDAEAIRLYKMLLFNPSTYLGGKITTYSTLKFKFSAKTYKKYCKKRGYEKVKVVKSVNNIVYLDNQVKVKPKMVFKDSLENISSFIYNNLRYPEGTLRLNLTGVVKLFFVIEPSGRITNIKVIKGIGGGAVNVSIRLLRLTKWEAGKKDGKKS